ncbi:MAG: 16S rRNA (cytosine(967)-C(5))-methyltransferase RsmB [Terracidiphilus sp.]
MAAISPARKAAFEVLLAVERGNAHADDLLRESAIDALSPADRHLATTLVLGVLRWQIRLDEQLKLLIAKPKSKLDPEVSIALRMGAFQLQFLDRVPAHAAIDESVELTKQSGHRFASGLVNAVLRKLAATGRAADLPEETAAELALAQAHPAWMVERWTRFYGLEAARAICHHGQAQPPRIVRLPDEANEAASVEAELIAAGVGLEPGAILTAARRVVSGDLTATGVLREGRVRLQDEGSQLIAELAACNPEDSSGNAEHILDACAAPGGKTLILAERNPQARILACESSQRRLAELTTRLAAHSARIECRLADATALNEDSSFDRVLADVPCSGTGTLGRNPEIRHRLRPEDLVRHSERQRAILSAALRAVRPGGRVVYSTCSLEPEENEQVVSAVLAENQNARQVSFEPRIRELANAGILTGTAERLLDSLTPEGALLLLPGALPIDGFFVALLGKSIEKSPEKTA